MDFNDLDRDGDLDLAVTMNGFNRISVFLNQGDGNFAPHVMYQTGHAPRALATGDVNGDGDPDLVVPNLGVDTVSVLLNIGEGRFGTDVVVQGAAGGAIALGDVDGDGDIDLAVTDRSSLPQLEVFLNGGSGAMTLLHEVPISGFMTSLPHDVRP